jgi:hypothetical protein
MVIAARWSNYSILPFLSDRFSRFFPFILLIWDFSEDITSAAITACRDAISSNSALYAIFERTTLLSAYNIKMFIIKDK